MSDACQGPVLLDGGTNARTNVVELSEGVWSPHPSVFYGRVVWPHVGGLTAPWPSAAQSYFKGADRLWGSLYSGPSSGRWSPSCPPISFCAASRAPQEWLASALRSSPGELAAAVLSWRAILPPCLSCSVKKSSCADVGGS